MKRNLIVLLLMFCFGGSAVAQVYNLGNSANQPGWYKLGNLVLNQQGADASIEVFAGNGYNANFAQQGETYIHFRTSNEVSENNGFFGSGSFYGTGRTKLLSNVTVVQVGTNSWDFYAILPSYTGGYPTLSLHSSAGSWTPALVAATVPAHSASFALVEEFHLSSRALFAENVGIGTATPTERLSVNGKIRAHEIKVETNNWPDYVFSTGYKRLSLPELKKFITQNRHLPGVPNARAVQQHGIDLGEMNRVLLQKIEELTLHLIEKDKQITHEQIINLQQQKRLEAIEKRINKR
ncbi:hypothetical protein [Pedobacter sp. AJM]|uniref:hypothetical protein n=1 Tax=Pedobacter sp. AJM TaxID=2003629 RepID=UPI000B4A6B81|nr:hypothetical protein [Pedobacter sp. AJM]OWK68860.1 hypothetical protein CBW18_19815 [Pedobacter sp. AJM]